VSGRLVWSLCGSLFASQWVGLVHAEVRGRDGPVAPWQEGRRWTAPRVPGVREAGLVELLMALVVGVLVGGLLAEGCGWLK